MATFTSAPVSEVVVKASKNTGVRKQAQAEITDALRDSLGQSLALVIDLDEGDKVITVMNRIKRAAETLGVTVKARKVRDEARIVAYEVSE